MDAPRDAELTALRQQLEESRVERDAALAREVALAEVLDVINRSPGDPSPVFTVILDKAMRLCDAAFGHLMTFDGKAFVTTAARGIPLAFAEFASQVSLASEHPDSALSQAVRGIDVIHQPDIVLDITRGFVAKFIITMMTGAANTPLITALQYSARIGSIGRKLINVPMAVASAKVA